jgi:hypothetical protein
MVGGSSIKVQIGELFLFLLHTLVDMFRHLIKHRVTMSQSAFTQLFGKALNDRGTRVAILVHSVAEAHHEFLSLEQ